MNLFDFLVYEQHLLPKEFLAFSWALLLCVMWLPVIGAVLVLVRGWPTQHMVKVDAPEYPGRMITGTLKDEYAESKERRARFNKSVHGKWLWAKANPWIVLAATIGMGIAFIALNVR